MEDGELCNEERRYQYQVTTEDINKCACVCDVCGQPRALSHDQSDASLRKCVTGCFMSIFIFMHAESRRKRTRFWRAPCLVLIITCPGPYPAVCRHEGCPCRNHHSGGHSGHQLLLKEIQQPRPGNGLYDQLPKVREHILNWDPCVTERLVAFNE